MPPSKEEIDIEEDELDVIPFASFLGNKRGSSSYDLNAGSPVSSRNKDDPYYEDKKHLIETYMECSGTKLDVKGLLNIVTFDVQGTFPQTSVKGKEQFFHYYRDMYHKRRSCLKDIEFEVSSIMIDGGSGSAMWTMTFATKACFMCPSTIEGITHFVFDAFIPHEPHDDEDHAAKRPVLAEPHFQICGVHIEHFSSDEGCLVEMLRKVLLCQSECCYA